MGTSDPRLVIVTEGRKEDAFALQDHLEASCGDALRVRVVDLTTGDTSSHLTAAAGLVRDRDMVLILASGRTTARSVVLAALTQAVIDASLFVVCAFDPALDYQLQAPAALSAVNGFKWPPGASTAEIHAFVRRMLGLDEQERRVFISYRRTDGSRFADQLRRALEDRGWKTFLDVYDVPPGRDFQADLFRNMDGRSMLLVVETPETKNSQWVDDEIAFAHTHGIGMRAIKIPSTDDRQDVERFPPAVSIRLAAADVVGSSPRLKFRRRRLDSLVLELQQAHTETYRLRYLDMRYSVSDFIGLTGRVFEPGPRDTLIARGEGRSTWVVAVTARRPSLQDFQRLRSAMESMTEGGPVEAFVVHRLRHPDEELMRTWAWMLRGVGVRVVPIGEFAREETQSE